MCHEHKYCNRFFWGVPFVLLFIALGSLLVMLLWNSLMPVIFGIKEINYLQAAGLLILSKILFGAFGRRHGHFYGRHLLRKKCECESEAATGETTKA